MPQENFKSCERSIHSRRTGGALLHFSWEILNLPQLSFLVLVVVVPSSAAALVRVESSRSDVGVRSSGARY